MYCYFYMMLVLHWTLLAAYTCSQEFLLRELTEDLLNGQTKSAASEVSVVSLVVSCRVVWLLVLMSGQMAGGDTLSTGRIPAGVDDATGRYRASHHRHRCSPWPNRSPVCAPIHLATRAPATTGTTHTHTHNRTRTRTR
jgi:hypothetical protein